MDGNERVSLQSSVKIWDDVVSRDLEGEAVILNLETEHYFGLDPVGRRVLEALTDSRDVRSAVATLIREFEVDEPTLQRYVIATFLPSIKPRSFRPFRTAATMPASAISPLLLR